MNRPVRILHTLSAIASGGVETRHLELIRRLPSSEYEHRFIGTTGGEIAQAIEREGVHVALLGPVSSVFATGRYRAGLRLARAWPPDIIHGAVMEGTVLGTVIARRLGLPVIVEETSDPANRRPLGHLLTGLVGRSASRCVAVSPAVGRYLTGRLRLPESKVRVITNGVVRPAPSTPAARSALRDALGIGRGDIVIGTVSRLFDDHKRVTDLIAAFAILAADHRELHLVVVGDGPDRPMMESAAVASGSAARVHFLGSQTPADPYYAIMDIFAIASSREAFGLVAAEAMRAGLPVVATSVGGLADIVVDGQTGFLVPPRAPAELAAALRRLTVDGDARAAMGAAGRRRADRDYSIERYIDDVEQLYRQVITEGR